MKKSKIFLSSGVLATVCLAAAVAIAAKNDNASTTNQGATPNGKPFVALNARVDDLQVQIDDLVGAVDSLEERVTGLEGAVADLEVTTAELESEIDALAVDVEANEFAILELAEQVIQNQNMIALMEDEIERIEAELAKKQNLIDGSCAEGSALRQINADGSVVCESVAGDGLIKFNVTNYVNVPKGQYVEQNCNNSWYYSNCYDYTVNSPQTRTVSATCPSGSMLIGGSTAHVGLTLRSEGESPVNTWTASATNYSSSDRTLYASAICVLVE